MTPPIEPQKTTTKEKLITVGLWLLAAGKANAILLIICLFLTTMAIQYGWSQRQQRLASEFGHLTQAPVTATTDAVITKSDWVTKHDLDELRKAVNKMGGKLVGGVKISVPAESTSVAHDSLPTTTTPDSTRHATFKDSTFAGTIEGTVNAPPAPAALGIDYTVTRPAFEPQVGFVEKDGQTYALVSWQGQTFQMKSAYAPKVNRPRHIVPFTILAFDPAKSWVAQIGVETRSQVLGIGGYAAVQAEGGMKPRALVGGKKDW